jgi:hypothetical protein
MVLKYSLATEKKMADLPKRRQPSKKEMVATSLRIDKELLKAVDDYAYELERSRNWIVNRLLKQSLIELNKL